MGSSLMLMSRWVTLSVCLIVLVVEVDMALCSERRSTFALGDFIERWKDVIAPPLSDGFCKASADMLEGYQCQEFQVTGKDGFILGVSRIPQGRAGSGSSGNRPPVIVQHGVGVDSVSWMMGSIEESLVMVLADSGFDVWVSNTRATRFSSRHKSLRPDQPEYWNWTWDEIIENDLPAVVDFVSQQTKQSVHYVGHSMGTLTALGALSEGKLVNQLSSVALLSPISYLNRMTLGVAAATADAFIGEVGELLGLGSFDPRLFVIPVQPFIPQGRIAYNLADAVSKRLKIDLNHAWTQLIAQNCCINGSAFLKFLNYGLQPSSMKNMVHFAQAFRKGVVGKYDYGSGRLNMKHYGQAEAPVYNLRNIPKNVPLFLSYGGNDMLADVNDVGHLLKDIQPQDTNLTTNVVKEYGHIDYMMASNAKEKAYNPMIDFLRLHTPPPPNHQNLFRLSAGIARGARAVVRQMNSN